MSPDPSRPAARRPFLVPFVLGLCTLIVVREGLPRIWPGVSYWVVFIAGLAIGWVVFTVAERLLVRRAAQRENGTRP
jgi:hypothetical protein